MGPNWDFFLIPSVGLSGGIMILWRKDLAAFSVIKSLEQCVIGELNVFNKAVWLITTVYGNKEVHKRRMLWECIQEVGHCKLPSVVGGDFNGILSQDDKRGGRKFVFSKGQKEMISFMNENDLHDISYVGPRFTWCNNKIGGGRILERLDRCLLNTLALNCLQVAVVRHLPRTSSDHRPIVLKIFDTFAKKRDILKFEDVWISYKASAHIIARVWEKKFNGFRNLGSGKKFWNKAPGFDGITYSFFKHYWIIVGVDVCMAVRNFFLTGKMDKDWKNTIVVLIPKSNNPVSPSGFRPISLYVHEDGDGMHNGTKLLNFHQWGKDLGIMITSKGQKISRLLYADDVLLFADARKRSLKRLKDIMNDYCNWTGQNINYHKSALICGKIINRRKKKEIADYMGFKAMDEMEYLGVKIALRRLITNLSWTDL
ncbi:hypothetical protein KFK09_009511 [Dendrobium nobile]|uniref:Reverse transcriptase domain-containing protein n=1 Tax=Dendrobium nobile TaxID=94219 RepID=A0A8T3BHC5_DENNO|nr:hypothetical protein KFK09_009511 [Dendrobium nobile]